MHITAADVRDRGISIQPATALPRAGFLRRVFAGIIDLMILGVPLSVFVSFLSVGMGISTPFTTLHPGQTPHELLQKFGIQFIYITFAFFIVMSWVYYAGCECAKWQATPGKRLFGLVVTNEAGGRVTFLTSSLRFWVGRGLIHAPYVGIYYFLVDCGRIPFSRNGRAIHDLIAGCWVRRSDAVIKFSR